MIEIELHTFNFFYYNSRSHIAEERKSPACICTYYESAPDTVANVISGHGGADRSDSQRHGRQCKQDVEQPKYDDGDATSLWSLIS